MRIITQLRFDDTFDRAGFDTARRIKVADTLDAGGLVDDVQRTVAFGDGFGRAIGHARAAGDAVFIDLHGHDGFS